MTFNSADPDFKAALPRNTGQFKPLAKWYRERPSQVAFAVSIVVHALLIAFIPGLRSVQIEPQRVLTVRIAEPEAALEQPVIREPVTPQPVMRAAETLPEPVLPPQFEPAIAQPRIPEQAPVIPKQAFEPQPVPAIRQPQQSQQVEQVARADLAPPVAREPDKPQPIIIARPDIAPAQTTAPLIKTEPLAQVERPRKPVTEVRRKPPDVPQLSTPIQPQPSPDVPRPVVRPAPPEEPLVAVPTVPLPPAVAPVARAAPAPAQTMPPVAATPVQPRPREVAPVVAVPAPQAPLPVVEPAALEAYRQSVSREVMRHMSYPRVAVMRKWQGKTIVEMRLSADGDVIQVVVAQSSGKDVLDDAAVKMVRRSLPLPKPPHGVRSVTVPVVFRLQG